MPGVIKERIPLHPHRADDAKKTKLIGFAGIATAVLAVLGGAGYGGYEFSKSKAVKQQTETATQEESKREGHAKLLEKTRIIDLQTTTKLKDRKITLTLPIKNSKISVGTNSFSVSDVTIGDAYAVGSDEYETEVILVLDIDGEKITYSAKAWASKKEESSYTLTFNQQ